MWVSHETIYLTLFIQARGGMKHQLVEYLRTRRANRKPKAAKPSSGKGRIVDPVMITSLSSTAEATGFSQIQYDRIHYVDRCSLDEGQDLIVNVSELTVEFVLSHIADVRRTDDIRMHDERIA